MKSESQFVILDDTAVLTGSHQRKLENAGVAVEDLVHPNSASPTSTTGGTSMLKKQVVPPGGASYSTSCSPKYKPMTHIKNKNGG